MVGCSRSGTSAALLLIVAVVQFICILRLGLSSKGREVSLLRLGLSSKGREVSQRTSVSASISAQAENPQELDTVTTLEETTKPKAEALAWVPSVCRNTTWQIDGIQIHVFGWRRPQSLFVLMEQLRSANYKSYGGWGQKVPLYFHVDAEADPLVTHIARSAIWPHGPVFTDVREERVGARDMWMSSITAAAREAGNNTLMLVFEDDMRVSAVYFQFLLRLIREYGRNQACRNSRLFGFSLSSVRLMEMRADLSFERWRAKLALPGTKQWHTYLATLPSTWGGAYWSDRWLEFADFFAVRSREPYYHMLADDSANNSVVRDAAELSPPVLQVPQSSSNAWTGSWKRFLVDFMYGCGLVMMYPNLDGENALATTLGLKSVPNRTSDSRIKAPTRALWQRVPRVAPLLKGDMDLVSHLMLPDFSSLQVLDLFMQLSTYQDLTKTAARFLSGVAADAELSEMSDSWCSRTRRQDIDALNSNV